MNKKEHKYTANLCKYKPNKCACNLYKEIFLVYGMGALGSDVFSEYLTDSTNFRIYIGTYDEGNEMLSVKCEGDSVHIIKTIKLESERDKRVILETATHNLKDLREQHKFE